MGTLSLEYSDKQVNPPKLSGSASRSRPRRPRGTGALFVRRDAAGFETWYGKWWVGSSQVKRKLGPRRQPSTRDGLTRSQAEAELRKQIGAVTVARARRERMTVAEAGELLVANSTARGLKRSTLMTYESVVRVHLAPYFGSRQLDRIGRREAEGLAAHMTRQGSSPKTVRNALGILHRIFEYARRQEWVVANPVTLVDKPRIDEVDPDIRFLEVEEVEALLRGVPGDYLGRVERPMYMAAAMTGMRQGELLALRWRDVDWQAGRVRVRRSFVRGEFGTPKSKRSSRSVPLADRLARELDRLHRETSWPTDDDLVFAHPAHRQADRPLEAAQALQGGAAAALGCAMFASTTCATPSGRAGGPWRADARAAGDDGPS